MAIKPSNPQLFERSQVSSSVTADGVSRFFEESGLFYQTVPEIGERLSRLSGEAAHLEAFDKHFRGILLKDVRLAKLLEQYPQRPPDFTTVYGVGTEFFHAATTSHDGVAVYVWTPGSDITLALGSHSVPIVGVALATMFAIPNSQVEGICQDVQATMEEGGVLMCHARMAVRVRRGLSVLYAWKPDNTR